MLTRLDEYTRRLELLARHLPYVATVLTHSEGECCRIENSPIHIQGDENLIIIYGLNIHASIYEWLAEDASRCVLFLEDTLEAYVSFLNEDISDTLLMHPQVHWAYVDDMTSYEQLGGRIAQKFPEASVGYMAASQKSEKAFLQLKRALNCTRYEYMAQAREFLGTSIIKNICTNVETLFPAYDAARLKGCLEGIPAVICGAGPSLSHLKNSPQHACLFACGAAINLLKGVSHFNVVIDPSELEAEYVYYQNMFAVPYCLRARAHPQAISMIQGPRILFPGVAGFPLSLFLERSFGFEGEELPGGVSSTTFGLRIALFMRCNPIFLCGIDLCRSGASKYSEFVSPNAEQASVSLEGINRWGKVVQTSVTWQNEAVCLGSIARQHMDTTIINCSEGLSIPDIPFGALFVDNKRDVSNYVHTCLQSCSLIEPNELQQSEAFNTLQCSLSRCRDLVEDILCHPNTSVYEALLEEELAYQILLKKPARIYGNLWEQSIQHQFNSWEKKLSVTMYLQDYMDTLSLKGLLV